MANEAGTGTPGKGRFFRILKRLLAGLLLLVIAVVLIVIIFLGPIVERVIEKRDIEYIGREIEIDDLSVKLFTGTVDVRGFNLFEADSSDTFVRVDRVLAKMKPFRALKKEIVVTTARIERAELAVSHNYRIFNFNDLIERFSSDRDTSVAEEEPVTFDWYWEANDLRIDSCRITYHNEVLDAYIYVDPLHFNCPYVGKYSDTVSAYTNLNFEKRGAIDSEVELDLKNFDYKADILIDDVPIDYLLHYAEDYLHVSDFHGVTNVDIDAVGNLRNVQQLVWHGEIGLDSLLLTDAAADSVLAAEQFHLGIREFDHGRERYEMSDLTIKNSYARFELFPEGDNMSALLKLDSALVDSVRTGQVSLPGSDYFNVFVYLANYAQILVESYTTSNFTIDSIGLHEGRILFIDHTLNEDALFLLENLTLDAKDFDTKSEMAVFDMSGKINKIGSFEALWAFDPKDVYEMDLKIQTDNFLVAFISPYSFYHTAYPFSDGEAFYDGTLQIRNRQLQGNNHIFVEDIQVGKKGFADPPIKLPLRLAIAILRDKDGNIDLEVPVEGDIDDPKFKLWKAAWTVLKNNLLKVAISPYTLFAKVFEIEEDKLRQMRWTYGQFEMEKAQTRQVKDICKVLNAKPEMALTYMPFNNYQRERDYLAIFSAKRDYYLDEVLKSPGAVLTAKDTLAIGAIESQDSLLNVYMRSRTDTSGLISFTDMAVMYVGADNLDSMVTRREFLRDSLFRQEFVSVNEIGPERIHQKIVDSLLTQVDTFNLAGPMYRLGFELTEELLIEEPIGVAGDTAAFN